MLRHHLQLLLWQLTPFLCSCEGTQSLPATMVEYCPQVLVLMLVLMSRCVSACVGCCCRLGPTCSFTGWEPPWMVATCICCRYVAVQHSTAYHSTCSSSWCSTRIQTWFGLYLEDESWHLSQKSCCPAECLGEWRLQFSSIAPVETAPTPCNPACKLKYPVDKLSPIIVLSRCHWVIRSKAGSDCCAVACCAVCAGWHSISRQGHHMGDL